MTQLHPRAGRRTRTWAAAWKALAAAAAAAMVLAGCSSSGGGGGESSSADTSANTASAEAGGTAASTATAGGDAEAMNVVKYIGGTSGKADSSLAPVTIGFVNQQGGPIAAPDATYGAQAAVKYINSELGGIDGHPLKLSTCFIVSKESEGQKCGQQFVNASDIPLITQGFMITGAASLDKTVAGAKPIIGSAALNPVNLTAKNSYYLYGTTSDLYNGLVTYAKSKGYKSVTIINDNSPNGQVTYKTSAKAFKAKGITAQAAQFPVGSSNVVGALVAGGAQDTDALAVFSTTQECIAAAKAIKQLNLTDKPTLASPTCIDPSVKKALGDMPQWTYTVSVNPADTNDPDTALFLAKYKKYSGGKDVSAWAGNTFAVVLAAAKMLNEAGGAEATAAQIAQKMKAFTGPMFLGPKKLECGANPKAPSSCMIVAKIQTYKGDGNWVTDGYYKVGK